MARIADIITLASEMANIPEDQIKGRCRVRRVVMVRAAVIHVARQQVTPPAEGSGDAPRSPSYPEIGRALGGFDHSTIIHGQQQLCAYCQRAPWLGGFIARLAEAVAASPPFVADRLALARLAAKAMPPPVVVIPDKPPPLMRDVKPRNDFLSGDTLDWLSDEWAGTQALADVIAETRAI